MTENNKMPHAESRNDHWILWLAVKGLVVAGIAASGWLYHIGADDRRYESLKHDYDSLNTEYGQANDSNRALTLTNERLQFDNEQLQKSLRDTGSKLGAQYAQCVQANAQFVAIFNGNSDADKQLAQMRKDKDDLDDGIRDRREPYGLGFGSPVTDGQVADMRVQRDQLQQQILTEEGRLQCEPKG